MTLTLFFGIPYAVSYLCYYQSSKNRKNIHYTVNKVNIIFIYHIRFVTSDPVG